MIYFRVCASQGGNSSAREPLYIQEGPMTRARSKRMLGAFNGLIQNIFISNASNIVKQANWG